MPGGMMGADLVDQLKRTNPELKVIYTTGYSPGAVGPRSPLAEGVNFLPKPYSPSRLAEIVRQCLDTKSFCVAADYDQDSQTQMPGRGATPACWLHRL